MADIFKHAYSLINPEQQKKKEWYEEYEEKICSYCPQMTWTQRIIGCLSFVLIGFLISLGSTLRFIDLMKGNPTPFAVAYTFGNLVGICATCFLFGPWTQFKKMFAPTRLFATSCYVFFMGLTLFFAFYPKDIPVRLLWIFVCIILQFTALVWYTISYIPFARQMVIQFLKTTCCKDCVCLPNFGEEESGGSMFGL